MMNNLLILSLISLIAGITYINGSPQNTFPRVRHSVRILNVSIADSSDESMLVEQKWKVENFSQIYSCTVNLKKAFIFHHVVISFERCRDLEISCENFQSWNLSSKVVCDMLKMKDQMWSSLVEALKPRTVVQTCPRVDKGIYKIEEVKVDVDLIVKFYSEAPKYYWKIHAFAYNAKKEVAGHVHTHMFFAKYTTHRRNE